MKRPIKKYDITQCALYKCRSKRRLEKLLQLDTGRLKSIDELIKYHSFEIDKKNSMEKRTISAPDRELKTIQKRILSLLQKVIRPEWLISSKKGKCYIDNGKRHINGCYMLTADIKTFYDNGTREAVYQFFRKKLETSPDVAKILTDLSTYNRGIPTGCPTSQIVAYYAYEDMFQEVNEIAQKYGCCFSLYVDDMTFSSRYPFDPKRLSREVDCTLRRYGHKPKYSKLKYYSAEEYKLVTGTAITPDNELAIPNSLQQEIYDSFQSLKRTMGERERSAEELRDIQRLQGQLHAAQSIDPSKFPEVSRIVGKMN